MSETDLHYLRESMALSDQELQALATQLGDCLLALNMRLATAESCTGGWLAKIITDLPGCSTWFNGSLVTYSNEAKQQILGVQKRTLDEFGAVSSETVKEMSAGVLAHVDADVALSISGIAGPGGGSDDKQVGLVWFGWGRRGKPVLSDSHIFEGDREAVRRQAVEKALQLLLAMLECDSEV
jgi:nicotinamide-nucleotide amidase